MSRGLRFPAALQVFPTLRDFIHVTPRRLANVPIAASSAKNEDIPACLRHVYHDLGVLVFAGLNNAQIDAVGEVVRKLVASGGIGQLMTAVDRNVMAKRSRIAPVKTKDYFEAVDWAHSGVLKPKTLMSIADDQIPEQINSTILLRLPSLDLDEIQLRERGMQIRGNPMPKGVLHSTVNGPRILPLDCFTSVRLDEKYSNFYGEVTLFSGGGKGQFVGNIKVDYTLLRLDEKKGQMKTLWFDAPGRESRASKRGQPEEDGEEGQDVEDALSSETIRTLRQEVFLPLWKLEREIYGDRADRLVRYDDFKTGLRRWSPKDSKGGRRSPRNSESAQSSPAGGW